MKTLLVQIRHTQEVLTEEHNSFLKYAGLEFSEMDTFNVIDKESFDTSIIDNYDGVFIGGASEANVLQPEIYPFMASLIELIRRAARKSIPTFASCFGFQAAVLAFEGEIIDQKVDFEMGTIPIKLTELGARDVLLCDIKNPFPAVSVHQQKAVTLPEECELLAFTDECCHIFKLKDKPFWGFQFHPEVDKQTLIDRLAIYQDKYTEGTSHYQNVIDNACETPCSNSLVGLFVDRVLKK